MATAIAHENGSTIPIMTGGVPQSPVSFQQPLPVHGGDQPPPSHQYNPSQGQGQGQRRPYNNRNANDEHCKIFVGGVGRNTTDESLREYFRKFGEIADSIIMIDKQTGEPRGFAFVTFKSQEAVGAVIEQCNSGGHTLDGKVIDPKPAVPQGPAQQTELQTLYGPERVQQQQQQEQQMQPGGNNFQYRGPAKGAPERKIFVGGVGFGTTADDVKQYFSSFGTVEAVDMPLDYKTHNPRGFAFVLFDALETVHAIIKDRYHQINGKTVEVKGADEQQAHLNRKRAYQQEAAMHANMAPIRQPGQIGTIGGYNPYGPLAGVPQQIIIPQQIAGGQTQYTTVQVPAAAAAQGGGYVFDPTTNIYYQLPPAMPTGQVLAGGGMVGATNSPNGIQLVGNPGQVMQSPQLQGRIQPGEMMTGLVGAAGHVGAVYPSETSTFGPSRTHILGGHQPIDGTTVADPHVVYSNAPALSVGESQVSSRGFHPYGR